MTDEVGLYYNKYFFVRTPENSRSVASKVKPVPAPLKEDKEVDLASSATQSKVKPDDKSTLSVAEKKSIKSTERDKSKTRSIKIDKVPIDNEKVRTWRITKPMEGIPRQES